jgi:hypothetical protein
MILRSKPVDRASGYAFDVEEVEGVVVDVLGEDAAVEAESFDGLLPESLDPLLPAVDALEDPVDADELLALLFEVSRESVL